MDVPVDDEDPGNVFVVQGVSGSHSHVVVEALATEFALNNSTMSFSKLLHTNFCHPSSEMTMIEFEFKVTLTPNPKKYFLTENHFIIDL